MLELDAKETVSEVKVLLGINWRLQLDAGHYSQLLLRHIRFEITAAKVDQFTYFLKL
jgi:hypothetical protein